MRKQTKLVAVLSAAALLAIGASMTSFVAAAHWDQQDGEWIYLDRNGDRMTDVWRKSNGQWYYLDENGYMAREQVIEDDEDKYYVDANGVRITNAWVSLDNDDLLDDDEESDSIDTVWMYFDGSGKALGADTDYGEIKRLTYGDGQSAYFIFNEDGYMLSGWKKWSKDGNKKDLYYLGTQDQGWAHTGWQYLEIDPDVDAFNGIDEEAEEYNDEEYFYFKSSGKAVLNGDESIGGKTYIFDEWGRMLDLWVYDKSTSSTSSDYTNEKASSSNGSFFKEDNGGREKNWIFAYPQTGYDNYSDDPYWFYLDNKGKPFRAVADPAKLTAVGSATRIDDDTETDNTKPKYSGKVGAKAIKGQTYLFNDKGVMLTGLYRLNGVHKGTSADPMDAGYYYFTIDGDHTAVEGQMVTNKRVTIDVHGDDETYYFKKSGEAYLNTIINGYVYGKNGQLVTDYGDGNTYQRVSLKSIIGNTANGTGDNADKYVLYDKSGKVAAVGAAADEVLVNENGKIRKSGTIKDVNEQKVTIEGNDYIVDKVEDDN